jgi:hypothetical protein
MAGPVIPPIRNPAWKTPLARPRSPVSTEVSSSVVAATVNMADPKPPTPRKTSSWA